MSERDSSGDEREEKEISELIDNPDVVTKYKAAAEIANAVMNIAREKCVEGGKISELCALLDGEIETRTSALYRKNKQMLKGVAFPACLSVNEIVGHYSPLADGKDPDTVLKAGDVVKCDLGAHFDGFMALCAETFVVAAPGAKFEGRKADVILAAWYAQEAALRTLKPGNTNEQVTEVINRIAADFKCTMVQGVLSHKLERNLIDGDEVILNHSDFENKVDSVEFEMNTVWALDIVMSTGDGKTKSVEERTTCYKRIQQSQYQLKMKASRTVLSDVDNRFPCLPFHMRNLDTKIAKFGIVECSNHQLVQAYPIYRESEGESVAHFKCTVLIMPNGALKITGSSLAEDAFTSEYKVTNEADVALLKTNPFKKKKKNKKKKKKPAAE